MRPGGGGGEASSLEIMHFSGGRDACMSCRAWPASHPANTHAPYALCRAPTHLGAPGQWALNATGCQG